MGDKTETDELFELKNCFYLGSYQAGINEGLSLKPPTDALTIERDCFIYRCYIAQGNYQLVLDEIKDSAPAPLQAVRLLATYLRSDQTKDIAMVTLKEWLADPATNNNRMLLTIAGIVYANEGNLDEALRCLHQAGTLESTSLKLQIYIRMNRLDLAAKELGVLQNIDDDAPLTQLSAAWLNVALGGEKVQDAFYSFTELVDKYSTTARLLNGLALCNMQGKKFEEAEKQLLEALEKNPKDPETLANLITCYVHLSKPRELISRNINQLKASSPNHPWLQEYNKLDEIFQRGAQRFGV